MNLARICCRSSFTICDILLSANITRVESKNCGKKLFLVHILQVELLVVVIRKMCHLILV